MPPKPFTIPAIGVATLTGAALLLAGPLDPPSGPVSSTYKTLAEVEPRIAINFTNTPGDADSLFKITSPGSYYLAGNIDGHSSSGKMGIEIAASHVSIDLMGFEVRGGVNTLDGIATTVGVRDNVSICNGVVRAWGGAGVDLTMGDTCAVERVHSTDNVGRGIVLGAMSRVTDCTACSNGEEGIATGQTATVENCVAALNAVDGVFVDSSSIVRGCTADGNGEHGFRSRYYGCQFVDCVSQSNGANGFQVYSRCTITSCTAVSNTGSGIYAQSEGMITNCEASNNGAYGIQVNQGMVQGCAADFNDAGGVFLGGRGAILDCTASSNTGPGFGTNASSQRIEGNTSAQNVTGFQVGQAGNIVVRNFARGNTTNYIIGSGNITGTIVTTESAMNGAANSNVNISM